MSHLFIIFVFPFIRYSAVSRCKSCESWPSPINKSSLASVLLYERRKRLFNQHVDLFIKLPNDSRLSLVGIKVLRLGPLLYMSPLHLSCYTSGENVHVLNQHIDLFIKLPNESCLGAVFKGGEREPRWRSKPAARV